MNMGESQLPTSLNERAVAALDAMGGRTALAARRLGRARSLPLASRNQQNGHDDGSTEAAAPQADRQGDEIFLRADESLPAGGLIALPIAIELLRRADLGQFDVDDEIEQAQRHSEGISDGAPQQEVTTIAEACARMLQGDSTAGDVALELIGGGEVNETLGRLNLTKTHLSRRFTGYADLIARPETVTSARDMLAQLSLMRGGALPGAPRLRQLLASIPPRDDMALPSDATLAHIRGQYAQQVVDTGMLTGPGGACLYCLLATEQRDTSAMRNAFDRVIHMLWDAWCAG